MQRADEDVFEAALRERKSRQAAFAYLMRFEMLDDSDGQTRIEWLIVCPMCHSEGVISQLRCDLEGSQVCRVCRWRLPRFVSSAD